MAVRDYRVTRRPSWSHGRSYSEDGEVYAAAEGGHDSIDLPFLPFKVPFKWIDEAQILTASIDRRKDTISRRRVGARVQYTDGRGDRRGRSFRMRRAAFAARETALPRPAGPPRVVLKRARAARATYRGARRLSRLVQKRCAPRETNVARRSNAFSAGAKQFDGGGSGPSAAAPLSRSAGRASGERLTS